VTSWAGRLGQPVGDRPEHGGMVTQPMWLPTTAMFSATAEGVSRLARQATIPSCLFQIEVAGTGNGPRAPVGIGPWPGVCRCE